MLSTERLMLSSISVTNFGCFDDQTHTVNFNKLNVLVGPNNSGKSTIFKALNLVRLYSDPQFGGITWNYGVYYNLQNNQEAVYNHDVSKRIQINVKYQEGNQISESILGFQNERVISDGLIINGTGQGSVKQTGERNPITSRIWYFAPNRAPINYTTLIGQTHVIQPLSPSGDDIIQFLIERWTAQDPNWNLAQDWIKRMDPQAILMKTPLHVNLVRIETERNDGKSTSSINLSLQGNGMQNAMTIVAAIIFSPPESTIIIEEPENFLHSRSIETLVDLFNYAVNQLSKQIIITTHSWEIINAYCSDIGEGSDRGTKHEKAKPEDFKLIVFNENLGKDKITEYDLRNKKYTSVRDYFKNLWG